MAGTTKPGNLLFPGKIAHRAAYSPAHLRGPTFTSRGEHCVAGTRGWQAFALRRLLTMALRGIDMTLTTPSAASSCLAFIRRGVTRSWRWQQRYGVSTKMGIMATSALAWRQ